MQHCVSLAVLSVYQITISLESLLNFESVVGFDCFEEALLVSASVVCLVGECLDLHCLLFDQTKALLISFKFSRFYPPTGLA